MNTLTTYTNISKLLLLQIAMLLLVVTSTSAQYVIKIAGNDSCGFYGDGGPALNASFRYPSSICRDNAGNIYIGASSIGSGSVRKITATTGIITTVAGGNSAGSTADNISATSAYFVAAPTGICIDPAGNLLIADATSRIRKVNLTTRMITTVAGTMTTGYSGDGGAATAALLHKPTNVATDAAGNIYILDSYNSVVRKVSISTGIITTVAGGGTASPGDGGPATVVALGLGIGVGFCVDAAGNIFIANGSYTRIRKVDAMTGIITTIAGTGGGFAGDGGPATASSLDHPYSVAVDNHGNVYINDFGNGRIRKITAATGIITTIMGDGTVGVGDTVGDGGPATAAKLTSYTAMACDTCGNVFLVSQGCHIRMITSSLPGTGKICGFTVDAVAPLSQPQPSLSIYPNPTSGAFTISISGTTAMQAHIVVTNALGQKVYEATATTGAPIPIQLISPPGTYFVHLATAASRWTEQVVVK